MNAEEDFDCDEAYKQQVIKNFIENGRLKNIPSQLKKRFVIWEYIMNSFDLHKIYSEKDVNEILQKYYDDFCTIRREFIVLGFMSRESGRYRRLK